MKELSVEEKARRYDEALEIARKCLDEKRDTCFVRPDVIFPELKESEDERIRKALYKAIWTYIPTEEGQEYIAWLEKQGGQKHIDMSIKEKARQIAWETSKHYDPLLSKESWCEMAALDMASWLEKQDKKSPFNKERLMEVAKPETFEEQIEHWQRMRHIAEKRVKEILEKQGEQEESQVYEKKDGEIITYYTTDGYKVVEPKFKVGEWITCEELNTALIVNIDDDKYEVEFIDGNKGFPHIDYIDRFFHLWSIEDAKEGDVLVDVYGNIGIFQKNDDFDWTSYYSLGSNKGFQNFNVEHENDKTYPATKEQRDILFAKMKEAGYEWDAEKKELSFIISGNLKGTDPDGGVIGERGEEGYILINGINV